MNAMLFNSNLLLFLPSVTSLHSSLQPRATTVWRRSIWDGGKDTQRSLFPSLLSLYAVMSKPEVNVVLFVPPHRGLRPKSWSRSRTISATSSTRPCPSPSSLIDTANRPRMEMSQKSSRWGEEWMMPLVSGRLNLFICSSLTVKAGCSTGQISICWLSELRKWTTAKCSRRGHHFWSKCRSLGIWFIFFEIYNVRLASPGGSRG